MKEKKATNYCTLCSSTEQLREFKSQYICNDCVKIVMKQKKEKER